MATAMGTALLYQLICCTPFILDFCFASIPIAFDDICVCSNFFIKESTIMYNDNKLPTCDNKLPTCDNKLPTCDKMHRMIYSLVANYSWKT